MIILATKKEFCDAMLEVYKNHGVYIGAANGEYTETLTVKRIHELEISYGDKPDINTRRDLSFIGKCYELGYDMSKSRSGDCSGIIVGVMRDLKIIKPTTDLRARDFQAKSYIVSLDSLQPGDLVFDTKSINATHVGVYVGDEYVIESRGRDYGVVKRKVSEGNWASGGRLDWFDDVAPVLTRNLKYVKGNIMTGNDIKLLQEQLNKLGYNCGEVDGEFGTKTRDAVIKFQKDNKLTDDGIVGQKTWSKLFDR